MQCNNCGSSLESDAKFCTNCGTPVGLEVGEKNQEASVQESFTADSVKQTLSNIQDSEYVEKGKAYAVSYLDFVKKALKEPFRTARKMQDSEIQTHGMATVGLYSFLMPLLLFFIVKRFNTYMEVSIFDVVIKPFVIMLIVSIVMAGVLFGVGRLMRVNVSYKAVLGAYGSLHVLPVALLLLSIILLVFNNYGLITLILVFSFLVTMFINVTILFALKSQIDEEIGLDVFYGIILSYIALMIIALIVGDSILGSLMGDMENILYNLMMY